MFLIRFCCSLSCCACWLRYLVVLSYLLFWFLALFNRNSHVRYSMPEIFYDEIQRPALEFGPVGQHRIHKDFCRLRLGSLNLYNHLLLDPSSLTMDLIKKNNPQLLPGGHWYPKNECVPFQKVAIIFPYRDRLPHLLVVLNRLHPMLQKQRIDYRIIIVEQVNGTPFNRGMLLNIGALESIRLNDQIDCFIFHDVDMIPEHDRNVYLCDHQLRHLSSAIDEMRYHVMYDDYVGGVLAVARDNFFKLNGFANIYWGWGNEDDDFSARSLVSGFFISRPPEHIGRYKMIKHLKSERNDAGYSLFAGFRGRHWLDGLNSLHRWNSQDSDLLSAGNLPLLSSLSIDMMNQTAAFGRQWQLKMSTNSGRGGGGVENNDLHNNNNNNKQSPQRLDVYYDVVSIHEDPLYTNITVRLIKPDESAIRQVAALGVTQESLFWILRFYGWFTIGGGLT